MSKNSRQYDVVLNDAFALTDPLAQNRRAVPDMRLNAVKELGHLIENLSLERPRRLLRNVFREAMNAVMEKYELEATDRALLTRMLCRTWQRGDELLVALGLEEKRQPKFNRPARAEDFIDLGSTSTFEETHREADYADYRPRLDV